MSKKFGVSLCMLLASATVQGAEQNSSSWYEGITIGMADYDLNQTEAERHLPFTDAAGNSISQDQYRFDTKTNAVQLFGGYRFNRYLALEVNLARLGTVDRDGEFNIAGGPLRGELTSKTRFKLEGFGASALGIFPINDSFDIFGRAGIFRWKVRAPFSLVSNGETIAQDSPTDSGTDPFFGVGGIYHWGDCSVRLEYQHYTFGKPFTAENDTDGNFVNASFAYNF